jgi:hypothetical protein
MASWRSRSSRVTMADGSGQVERRHPPHHLVRHAEELAARGEGGDAGAPREQIDDERCGRVHDVFGVVQHEQRAGARQPTFQLDQRIPAGRDTDFDGHVFGGAGGQDAQVDPPGNRAVVAGVVSADATAGRGGTCRCGLHRSAS